uniref:GNAT family N-acetyltransferase n=1 Tax=Pandoraea pnomenusa TaxID=93220 RepID=UPI001186B012|nr:GNAT family N-acetyltransferase [Pandoraea pnomenusa]
MNLRGNPLQVPNSGKNRATSHYSRFKVRMLSDMYFQPLVSLRKRVIDSLPHPDLYVPEVDEISFINNHCGAAGESIGIFSGDDLIAYAMLGLPEDEGEGTFAHALDIGSTPLNETAYLSSCMVLPGFRGHGLQRALISSRMTLARILGRGRCIAIVSPHNHISRQNLLDSGLHLIGTRDVDGHMRQIMSSLPGTPPHDWRELAEVDACDVETQAGLVERGFLGFAQTMSNGNATLIFGRSAARE